MEADAGEGSVVAVRPRAAAAPGGAAARPLEAAFATAMSSPRIKVPPAAPAALEEEWYVSIDGDQSGPFSLAQAQAWVAGRAHDDELYCWSEGFDDWLPVEKVSHFRGLRGRSRPRTEPPPLPMEAEPEPQPLFAATLAALEAEAPTSIGGPPPASEMAPRAAMKPSASASAPIAAKPAAAATPSNGRATPVPGVPAAAATPSLPSPLRGTGPKPALPGPNVGPRAGAPPLPGTPTRGTGPAAAMKSPTGPTTPVTGAPPSTPTAAPAPAIPASIASMFGGSGATPAAPAPTPANGHDAPMFDDAGLDDDEDDAVPSGSSAPDALSAGAARGGKPAAPEPEPDDLAIGEVSRVVRIADLARPEPKTATQPIRRSTQAIAVARGTGMVPKYDAASLAASGDVLPPPLTGAEHELVKQLAQEPTKTSRHMLWLAGGIGAIAVVATVVIVLASRGGSTEDDGNGPRLLEGEDLADVAISVEVMPTPRDSTTNPTPGPGSATAGGNNGGGKRPNTGGTRPANTGAGGNNPAAGNVPPERAGLYALSGEDVEQMSQKMSIGPRRCYEQAKKKDPFLEVKRLRAVITVNTAGTVTRVELLDHANEQLDTCLSNALGRWKFRENSEGLTSQVSFQFMST
jgi:hypothetical protein